jgi:hypothetical protein
MKGLKPIDIGEYILKSKIMAITVALALVLTLVFAVAGPVAASPVWNVSGTWQINVIYNSTTYPEILSLTQSGSAITGVYIDTIPPGSYFAITTGSVSGNHVVIDGTQGGLTVELLGDIANDGSMGGTWSDIVGGSRTGSWHTTSGTATQIADNGGAQITGNIVAPTISMTAPGAIDFTQFTFGVPDQKGPMAGTVVVVPGSANNVFWTVKATDVAYGNGYMWTGAYGTGGTHLTDPLYILVDGVNWNYANVNAAVTGSNNGGFSFYAKQTAEANDAAATYSDIVVFSVAITSFN